MLAWYLHSTLVQRLYLALLLGTASWVAYRFFLGLLAEPWSWYRGVQSTPVFQVTMWVLATPFIVPVLRRRLRLRSAPFVGNVRSRVYHRRDCEYQIKITSFFFKRPFNSGEDACRAGFRPCRFCDPPISSPGPWT